MTLNTRESKNMVTFRTESNSRLGFETELEQFVDFGTRTQLGLTCGAEVHTGSFAGIPTYVNEFWTSKQRAANSLHEVSYRACFKPQLPRFFIERLTEVGDLVYDPFMGRGTTLLEAALLGRKPYGCDVNPLSAMLTQPRLRPPRYQAVLSRIHQIDFGGSSEASDDLLAFYHSDTLSQIIAVRTYLLARMASGEIDDVDEWIRLVAINRLTGHSPGFFSVYTLPPNQAVSPDRQRIINQRRKQTPPTRDVPNLILSKTRSLLQDCDETTRRRLRTVAEDRRLLTRTSDDTPEIESESVSLVVTSPPFLDVVDYAGDNWLRCWFADIDPSQVPITILRKLQAWQEAMTRVFRELVSWPRNNQTPGRHM